MPLRPTLADGLAVGCVGELPFALAAPLLEQVVTVSEEQISLAILRLAELEKSVVEGAGAAALAACLDGRLPELHGRRVVLILTGGNIDLAVLGRVIEHGLVTDGRLCRFSVLCSDRPGGLARLAELIAAAGASIKEIAHDRAFGGPDVTAVNIVCTVETADRQHIAELYSQLRSAGFEAAAGFCVKLCRRFRRLVLGKIERGRRLCRGKFSGSESPRQTSDIQQWYGAGRNVARFERMRPPIHRNTGRLRLPVAGL